VSNEEQSVQHGASRWVPVLYTREEYTRVYRPIHQGGVYPGSTSPSTPPWVHFSYTALLFIVPALRIAELRCQERRPWAQKEDNPWVRGKTMSRGIYSVRKERNSAQRLLGCSEIKDR